tara:strand:+ start:1503 stop:1679 length:177 start_codon:yes stop_codon:yes gene_type:complete
MKKVNKNHNFQWKLEIETNHSILSTSTEGVFFQELERWVRSRCSERQIKVLNIDWNEK